MIAVVPYAYWLHTKNRLHRTTSTKDTKCLYYFSSDHIELEVDRKWDKDCLQKYPNKVVHVKDLKTSKWLPPPYKLIYANDRYRWEKPLCIIGNKYTTEWKGPPINFLSLELLEQIIDSLQDRYQIIYNRPYKHISVDGQKSMDFGDYEMIRNDYPEVIFLDELFKDNGDHSTFNKIQFEIYANCDHFISVQGGGSVLSSYFGGTNLILAKRGHELNCNSYSNWYDKFAGTRIRHTNSDEKLLEFIRSEFL